ncbi:hypothetical protein Cgig2_014444 [Carnegiea gigantea]|uniref:Uncharacterized protein n=1 Tax=Carnegiea gigantea TaxID=171969 RepID=A0A9Q1QC69_9CARY|nr:hypothetical protein Cgig2_014444 [Carnegiea gigantea]
MPLDDIDMIPDLEEEEVEHVGENIFESRVLINMNPSLINIPDDFKDDKEGDDVEENQRNNTPLAGEPIRDTLIIMPTLAKNNGAYIKDAGQIENTTVLRDKSNSLQVVNKSCTNQIGKKHINVTNRIENSTIGIPQTHNLVNQVSPYFVHINITL